VYAVAILYGPVFVGIRLGTVSPLLALLCAALWRYRDRTRPAALLLAAVVVAKLFLWPLALWLVVTRRYRSAAGGVAIAGAVTLAAWAWIGFAGLSSYIHVLSLLTVAEQGESFSSASLGVALGLSSHAAHVLVMAAGATVLALAALRRRSDREAFVLCVGAALLASPIVWQHYFALLLVPVAIAAPRFAPIWLLPLLLWLVGPQSHGNAVAISVAVLVPAAVLAWALNVGRLPTIGLVRPAVHLAPAEGTAD
jgi:hypothetical protein